MHKEKSKKNIVILGNNLDGWFTASSLARVLNLSEYTISLIGPDKKHLTQESELGDCSLPDPRPLHPAVWMNEEQQITMSDATLSFGIALSGWSQPNNTYFHPFSSIGAKLDTVAFHHLTQRLRSEGTPVKLSNFTLASLAAQAQRLELPNPDTKSVLSTCEWGMQINRLSFCLLKRKEALAQGVMHITAGISEYTYNSSGGIATLTLTNSSIINPDLLIDCSLDDELKRLEKNATDYIDWSQFFPCNQAVTLKLTKQNTPPPYTHALAHQAGWIRHTHLQGYTLVTNYYSSKYMSENEAIKQVEMLFNGQEMSVVHTTESQYGRLKSFWQNNLIRIGQKAFHLDPVGVSNLQMLRSSISKLLKLLPNNFDEKTLAKSYIAKEFNRQVSLELDNARDFALLHYKLNARYGEPFWDTCRKTIVPEVLDYKLVLFKAKGLIALQDEEPLQEQSWINLLDEHGIEPRNYNPIANSFSSQQIVQHLQRIRSIMLDAVAKMPLHTEYLIGIKKAFGSVNKDMLKDQ